MIIIQAANIHESAGKILLVELLAGLVVKFRKTANASAYRQVTVFVDKRFGIRKLDLELTDAIDIIEVNPTITGRIFGEFKLYQLSKKLPEATVFCFGNLPPLFKIYSPVIMYFHTVLYFKRYDHVKPRWQLRFKHLIERFWLKYRIKSVKQVLVQSQYVKEAFESEFRYDKIRILPFASKEMLRPQEVEASNSREDIEFLYLAAATPHKNYSKLLDAWELLAAEKIYPRLHITVGPRHPDLLARIEVLNSRLSTKITNLGLIKHSEAMAILSSSKALIFPSLCESLGLPIVEAQKRGIPVLAAELDYVRDLIDPVQTFDPNSAISISRAVRRFLGNDSVKSRILTADDLAEFLIDNKLTQLE